MIDVVCSIPLIASLFAACASPLPLAVGYVEGEYVLIAPIETSRITNIKVKRGERIKPDQRLAVLEKARRRNTNCPGQSFFAEAARAEF